MINIAIIGAGNIGSRHLQAMARWEGKVRVQLVDPAEGSLRLSQARFQEVYQENSNRIEVFALTRLEELSGVIDVAIIATPSPVRAQVIRDIIRLKQVKNFILEKILFQTVDDYFEIERLLSEKDIPAWVNCYMRAADFFKTLKRGLNMAERIQIHVNGSFWGMGTTSIHYIDLFSFLTGSKDFEFSDCCLEETVIEAKRPGFKEFFGELIGGDAKGNVLSLKCRNAGSDPQTVRIKSGLQEHEIQIFPGNVLHRGLNGKKTISEKVPLALQSETTHRLVAQILKDGVCDLTPFAESVKLHLPLIKVFLEHLSKLSHNRIEVCPVT